MPTRSVFISDAAKENAGALGDKNAEEFEQAKPINSKPKKSEKNGSKNENDENGVAFLETILNEPSKQSEEAKRLDNLHANSDLARPDHNKENSDQREKLQFIRSRPTTAKPSGLKRRSASTSSEKSSDSFEKVKGRSSSTSASLSSFSTFEGTFDENDSVNTFDRDVTENLITYRESQIREELLHRYLDLHICESYEKQNSKFDRYSRQPPTRPKGIVSRKPNSSKFRKFNDTQPKLERTKSAYSKQRQRTRLDVVGSREAEVKRTIRRLIRELRKLEAYRLFLSHRMPPKIGKANTMTRKPPRPKTAKSGKQRKERSQQKNEVTQTETKEEVVVIPSTNDQQEPKSILKSTDANGDLNKEKHVQLKNRRDSNDSFSSTERNRDNKHSNHYYYQGQVFSYDYLASLLGTLQCSKSEIKGLLGPHGPLKQVSLLRAPIRPKSNNYHRQLMSTQCNKLTEFRTGKRGDENEKDQRQKNKQSSHSSARPKSANPKGCIVIKDDGKFEGNISSSSPRVTPGTEPIKCNWQPEKQPPKERKETDHQLKKTDNPAITEWLRQKNSLARQEKHVALRRSRVKRNKLLDEYNEKEEHREQAVIEYERWKKRKNREILLRRRKEALDANCEKSIGHARPITTAATTANSSPNTKQTEHLITTFSDLRSSATVIPLPPTQPSTLKNESKRRPKSAPTKVSFNTPIATHAMKKANFVPVKINFENGDVTLVKSENDNLSAREPITGNKSTERAANGFLREFLEVTSEKAPSMFDIPPPGTFPQPQDGATEQHENNESSDRNQYNEWVRTDEKSPMKPKNKRKTKSKEKDSKLDHDPLTNELISDLAKRRIQKILDQKKRVDSGLKPRPASASPVRAEREPNKKWRMAESEALVEEKKEKKKGPKRKGDERPKFSFDRKTDSTTTSHQRNPVIRQALNKTN